MYSLEPAKPYKKEHYINLFNDIKFRKELSCLLDEQSINWKSTEVCEVRQIIPKLSDTCNVTLRTY